MRNRFIRLAEIIQEDAPGELPEMLLSSERQINFDETLQRINALRNHHEKRSADIWHAQQRVTPELRAASARADLASFFAACLTGSAGEHRDTALEALQTLGRQAEYDLIRMLARR
ncbi:hypothetical protein SAMN05660860_02178 [Geoalkalibacter ferrihydriticus]|uniref:Uncharacterized protein n=2 Tax=Geoalkalibacter ferrihydriticus TaxID=392333 RepID=A0A0C2HJL0_9BACT|nr:hypothetical protein [Geoalkalibacter ferrihydriticus]KIH77241.1 hypothetical protein GFER_00240 [Geoalkalibacter ferrihydriticus DSM 17813]SDM23867.1 hypothetical protein SAMN05660860_02178 [Geoalkalibacter ferrihydriticus]